MRNKVVSSALIFLMLFLGIGSLAFFTAGPEETLIPRVSADPATIVEPNIEISRQSDRSITSYWGLGTWVDSYDMDPTYVNTPTVTPADITDMAGSGIRTLYMQAARSDSRARWPITDPWILTEFLLTAHEEGIEVVAWYLPKWNSSTEDIERLLALSEFEVLGHSFDGIAVDIEWNNDGLEGSERSQRLFNLSSELREFVGDDPLGAIVMPPVLTEEINPDFWPDFPWREIAPIYDVWLPMSYWSFRTEEHADPYYYSGESIRLLRTYLGDPEAKVHGIGGIGLDDGTNLPDPGEPLASIDDLQAFVDSLIDTNSIGGSIYDWATTGEYSRQQLAVLFADL
ncbi:MAG: hypothetical protein P8K64_06705 [Acidimicrobiales bacterium]|nr:hypothetical protein [Acidimicrobiales bacterium]